ncbi:MAG: sulfatase-like hydrolase/transferase, partial [Pirellula sp.]
TAKALKFIDDHAKSKFFLYFATHDIHVPRVPHSRFEGKSGTGPRGDAMLQLDWCVGQVLNKLDQLGIAKNTVVIFTSDNGPVLDDGYVDDANEKLGKHDPNGIYRAGKYSMFEGGTRVPLLVRWPDKIPAGQVSNALFGQIDFAKTFAAIVGATVDSKLTPDSRDELDCWTGNDKVGRPFLVHEAAGLALRMGSWKLIPSAKVREDLGPWRTATFDPPFALYDLSNDPAEQTNLAAKAPEKLIEMQSLLKSIRGE